MNILTDYAMERCQVFGINPHMSELKSNTLLELYCEYTRFAIRSEVITDRLSGEILIHYTSITASWYSRKYLLNGLGISK